MKTHRLPRISQATALCIAVFVMALLSRGEILASKALSNTADLMLNQILWSEDASWRTSSRMLLAAKLYQRIPSHCVAAPPSEMQEHQTSEHLALATQSCRDKCAAQTAIWLRRAAESPKPREQPLMIPGDVGVSESGDLLLGFRSSRWQVRPDSDPVALDEISSEHVVLNIPNTADHRETVVYSWGGPLDIETWHTIHIRLKGSPDLLFTLEVHSQNELRRYINYQELSGDWEEFSIPLAESSIEYIYLTFKETETPTTVARFAVNLDCVAMITE